MPYTLVNYSHHSAGFPGSSAGEESTSNAGDPGSIPGFGRSIGEGIDYPLQYSWASPMAQLVRNLPAVWETWVWSLGWEDSLEKGMATHSSILSRKESDTTEWLIFTSLPFTILYITSQDLLRNWKFIHLTPFNHLTHSPTLYLWQPPIYSLYLWAWFGCYFLDSKYKWDHMVLSFSVWLISFSITPSSGKGPACQCRRCKRCRFDPMLRRFPGEGADHSSILSWEIPWTEKPGGLQYMGLRKSHIWLSMSTCMHTHTHTHTHTQCRQGPSMLWQMARFHSFLWLNYIVYIVYIYTAFLYPFIHQWTVRCFPSWLV